VSDLNLKLDLPLLAVSACLLGEKVRYDGGDKFDPQLAEALGRRCTLLPVCPEAGCGLATPREAMRLEGDPQKPRLIVIATGEDLSERMQAYCRTRVAALEDAGIAGFVCKRNSPSCGLERVSVWLGDESNGEARGLFAAEAVRRFPGLPAAEAEALADPEALREFLEGVFACACAGPEARGETCT